MGDGVVMVRHFEPNPHRVAQDFWVLPGGGVEPGEGVFAAAEREVLEETGLVVRALEILHLREAEWNPSDPAGWGEPGRSLEVYVRAELVGGTLRLGRDPELAADGQVLREVAVLSRAALAGVRHFPEYLLDLLAGGMPPRFERF